MLGPEDERGPARTLPWNQASLLVTQRFGRIDPGGLAGREEGGEQRGEVGEAHDDAQGAPWHRVADAGDLLLEEVDDPDRERRAEGHAESDAQQGHERRL